MVTAFFSKRWVFSGTTGGRERTTLVKNDVFNPKRHGDDTRKQCFCMFFSKG